MFIVFISLCVFISAILGINIYRIRQKYSHELTPNCLLTRYPILFIEGEKSIFYFSSYWNHIPNFLSNHGYEVQVLELPWRGYMNRAEAAREFLKFLKSEKFHIIADHSQRKLLTYLSNTVPEQIQTLSIIEPSTINNKNLGPTDLTPSPKHIHLLEITPIPLSWCPVQVAQGLVWLLHRLFMIPRATPHSSTIGLPLSKGVEHIHGEFLSHAVTLAEMDLGKQHDFQPAPH